MKEEINKQFDNAKVVSIPVADGGEGSVDCFVSALDGKKMLCDVSGPYFDNVSAFFGLIDGGKTAVIEMAAAAGLPMVENNKNPLKTTTFGVGQLMLKCADLGVEKIIVGLGGSCTNDFGCGAACACGVQFYDCDGKEFIPVGGTLNRVKKIIKDNLDVRLKDIDIIVMCDIDNPPFGEEGASFVFAPQKGADAQMVKILDDGVENLCKIVEKDLGLELKDLSGGGAAGAMGAGMVAFFDAKLKMGIDTVLETVGFDQIIKDASVIFTGEGKIDSQSLRGKVVIGVARKAKEQNVPVIAVVGGADGDMCGAYSQGVSAVFAINRLPQDFSVSRFNSEINLKRTMEDILRLLKI